VRLLCRPALNKEKEMTMKVFNLNSLIKQVVYPLSGFMRKKIKLQTRLTVQDLHVLADWERIAHVVASLVEYGNVIIREHGTINIETKLLPVESPAGKGCACALVSITTRDTTKGEARTEQGLLAMIRSIIKNQNGSVRIFHQEGKAECKIYLPLLLDNF
jgi:hypothetical protein